MRPSKRTALRRLNERRTDRGSREARAGVEAEPGQGRGLMGAEPPSSPGGPAGQPGGPPLNPYVFTSGNKKYK